MAIHLSTDNLIRVLEAYALGRRWRGAMESIGAAESSAYKWLTASKYAQRDDDVNSVFFIEHRGAWDYWHNHCRRARSEALNGFESTVREQATFGVDVPVIGPNGQLWKENPATVGKDDDTLDLIYGIGKWDRLLRDSEGNAIALTKTEQLPATTRNKILDQIPGYRDAPPQINIRNSVHLSAPIKALRREAPRPGEPASLPPPKEQTPMVRDLLAHLKAGVANPKPDGPVEIFGRATGDKPDNVSTFPADEPQTLADHPRVYTAEPTLVPAPPPVTNYARKLSTGGIDAAGMGRGPDPSLIGKSRGFKVAG